MPVLVCYGFSMKILCRSSLLIILILCAFKEFYKDVHCIDGDTFKRGFTYYRLAYIDTPEKTDDGYQQASLFTCKFIKQSRVKIKVIGRDVYNRRLVIVSRDDVSLNNLLIGGCFAEPFYGKTTDEIINLYKKCYDLQDNRKR